MRARGVWLGIAATVLVASALPSWSMELRDMPPWLRDMIEPVHVTTPDGEASGETAGVHIWGEGLIGAPAVVLETTDAPSAAAVTSPGALTVPGAGRVSLSGMDSLAVGGVRAPSAGDLATAGVTISPMAAEWDKALRSIEGLDRQMLAKAGQILAMVREQSMSAKQFSEWIAEHRPAPEVLSAGVAMVGFHRRDNYPTPQPEALVLASGLAILAEDDLSQVETIPPFGRLWLAILLSRRGDEANALRAFDSMSDAQLVVLPRETTVMAIAHLIRGVPRTAVFAIKRYAAATEQEAGWCLDLERACRRAHSSAIVGDELLPFASAALEAMPPTMFWDRALYALLSGYQLIGDDRAVVKSGDYWLQALEDIGVDTWTPVACGCRVRLARSLAAVGEATRSAGLLRAVVAQSPEPYWGEVAQCDLLRLAEAHPELGDVRILPARFHGLWPHAITELVAAGSQTVATVDVTGTATFQVDGANCSLPFAAVEVGKRRLRERASRYSVQVRLTAPTRLGPCEGTLAMQTNDPTKPNLLVPIRAEVAAPISVAPARLFFGLVPAGAHKSTSVRVTGASPFVIHAALAEEAQIATQRERQDDVTYVVTATLRAPDAPTVLRGTIILQTNMAAQRTLTIPYYAHIVARE